MLGICYGMQLACIEYARNYKTWYAIERNTGLSVAMANTRNRCFEIANSEETKNKIARVKSNELDWNSKTLSWFKLLANCGAYMDNLVVRMED